MNRNLIIGVLSVMLTVGYAVSEVLAQDVTGPTIENAVMSPTLVSAGTPVTITADVSDPSDVYWLYVTVYAYNLARGDVAFVDPIYAADWVLPSGLPYSGVGIFPFSHILNTSGLSDGDYEVEIFVNDLIPTDPKNETRLSLGILTIDSSGPTVENAAMSDDVVSTGTPVTVTADVSDPSGVVWVVVTVYKHNPTRDYVLADWTYAGVESYAFNYSLDTSRLPSDGEYEVELFATDPLFNWGITNNTRLVVGVLTVDSIPPVVTISHPKDGDITSAVITVSGSAVDAVSGPSEWVDVYMNAARFNCDVTGKFGELLVDQDGIDITVKATDEAGNVGSDTVSIIRKHDMRKH